MSDFSSNGNEGIGGDSVSKAKRKGMTNELRTMKRLEALGYYCVRSAGSHGLFDVVGIGPSDVKAIQVKTGRWPGSEEMEAIELLAVPPNVSKEVWRWDRYQRHPKVRRVK